MCSFVEPLVMSQDVPPRVGGGCSVWECEEAVIAASLCGKHRNLADNTAFQDGAEAPSPEFPSRPVNGVKHTAKRTKRFFIRRSGIGSTPVKSEAPQVPADSGNPIPFGLANANANANDTPRKESKGLPDNYVETYPTQASSRPSIPTQAKSCAVNTIIVKNSQEGGISTSSTAQQPVSNSSLNIICATGDDSITGHRSKPLDIVDTSHASAAIDDHGGPISAHGVEGKLPMPPLNLENIQSSKPREPVHSASTSLNGPRPSVQVEHAEVCSGAPAETSLKRKLDPTEYQESRPEFDFPRGQKQPAPVDVYRAQHPTDKTGVAIPNSVREQKRHPIGHKEIESSADTSTPFSIEAGSQKGLRAAKRRIVRRKPSILLAKSKASTQAKRASEPNLKAQRGASITSTPTMGTMGPKESHSGPSGPVSENIVYTEVAVSVNCCPEDASKKSPNSQQDQPGLAIKQSSGKQSFPSRSTDHSMAPLAKNISMVNRVKAPPRVTAEERRMARILNFDSAAFDAMIYRQAGTRPPRGVVSMNSRQRTPTPSNEGQRLYLHTNPAIHRLHNRSEEWHQAKALEIKARGRRKAWFGKAVQRERWLRAKERVDEEKRQKALASGSRPTRPEPQPWTYSRAMDFGDVPPEKLPEDVLQNPAWAKACAWHRENRAKRVFRQQATKNRHQQAWDHLKTVMKVVESASNKKKKKKRGEGL